MENPLLYANRNNSFTEDDFAPPVTSVSRVPNLFFLSEQFENQIRRYLFFRAAFDEAITFVAAFAFAFAGFPFTPFEPADLAGASFAAFAFGDPNALLQFEAYFSFEPLLTIVIIANHL